MGSSSGIFTDQNPFILGTQVITARTNVKTDLNTSIIENDSLRSTGAFLVSQYRGTQADNAPPSALITAQNTVGAAQTSNEIGGGGQPCFSAITKIAIPAGWKYICEVKVKDIVITFDAMSGQLATGMVTDKVEHLVTEYGLVKFTDGHSTMVDAEGIHRYWIGGGSYQSIKDLEWVWHLDDGGWVKRVIEDFQVVKEEISLFNITVANYHNYIANGDAVSNAKPPPDFVVD